LKPTLNVSFYLVLEQRKPVIYHFVYLKIGVRFASLSKCSTFAFTSKLCLYCKI